MVIAKGKGLGISLLNMPDSEYNERISIPFPLDEVSKLKIGQEVVITIRGCVKRLEGDDIYSAIGVDVYDKKFRKTSNQQAEGIRDLVADDTGDY